MVGSTVDGRIGEGSADIKAFQPFFADLDSPQTLTAGDEISLPAPIRNYTDKEQMVAVELNTPLPLAAAGPTKQTARLAASSSATPVFRLRATAASSVAKLRVTARGKDVTDAIEKSVSIHPDGRPVSRSVSDIVESVRLLRIETPVGAIAGSIHAEVNITGLLPAAV